MYDVIGDIHGYAAELKTLLQQLGYTAVQGVWHHPGRKALFVGDYIDRGPAIRETLHMVKSMVDNGQAIALMGNHEYNALAYHHRCNDGSFLRAHTPDHIFQHQATLAQFKGHEAEWNQYLQWFYTLPLFLEQDGLRAVHACWIDEYINWLKTNGRHTIDPQFLVQAHRKGAPEKQAVDITLKGVELTLPAGITWIDSEGKTRYNSRIKWWMQPGCTTSCQQAIFQCPDALYHQPLPTGLLANAYPTEAPPVFIGHYWLNDQAPAVLQHNVVCLDYSVAKGGSLAAYRWQGEKVLTNDRFVCVPAGR